jgi:hypothetical protein
MVEGASGFVSGGEVSVAFVCTSADFSAAGAAAPFSDWEFWLDVDVWVEVPWPLAAWA